MLDYVEPLPTLSADDQTALQRWLRAEGVGSTLSDVEPLTGGSQNVVVRLRVDGRPMVLRRPPAHPRPNSNKTMQREIAVLQTLAGTAVPHPGFIAGCTDLDVLGVVFYLMEEVDGFNPGIEIADAYVRDARMRHDVGPAYAASLAQLGNVEWEGRPLAALKRPGSFLERQVPQFLRLLESYRHDNYSAEELPDVAELAGWLQEHRPPDTEPGIMHGDAHLNNVLLRHDRPEVAAFVDWEMCTIGDPLLDLGWLLVCWPVGPNPINAGAELGALGGSGRARRTARGLPRRRRARHFAAGLVCRARVFQAGHRHRGHLVAAPGRAGAQGGRGTIARLGGEPDRSGHPGGQRLEPVRVVDPIRVGQAPRTSQP